MALPSKSIQTTETLSCLSLYIFVSFWRIKRRQKSNIPHLVVPLRWELLLQPQALHNQETVEWLHYFALQWDFLHPKKWRLQNMCSVRWYMSKSWQIMQENLNSGFSYRITTVPENHEVCSSILLFSNYVQYAFFSEPFPVGPPMSLDLDLVSF